MILKHDEPEPLELSSGPYGDADMESLKWALDFPKCDGAGEERRVGKLTVHNGASETPFLARPMPTHPSSSFRHLLRVSPPGDA